MFSLDFFYERLLFCITVPPSDSLMCQPQFVKPLSDMTIKDGEAMKLTCIVKGDPDPNVTWMKNGEVIKLKLPYFNVISVGIWISCLRQAGL